MPSSLRAEAMRAVAGGAAVFPKTREGCWRPVGRGACPPAPRRSVPSVANNGAKAMPQSPGAEEVAGNAAAVAKVDQRRINPPALVHRLGAARVEAAARGRVQRAWYLALDDRARPPGF